MSQLEPRNLSTEQELLLEKNTVWLFSSPKSGTTWLASRLLSYNTKNIDELSISPHLGLTRPVENQIFLRDLDRYSTTKDYFFSNYYKKTWIFYLRKLILNRIYAQVQDFTKKIIIKEPAVPGASDIIADCLPNSKIIILLRDGRDILDSILDARQKKGFMTKAGEIPLEKTERLKLIRPQAHLLVQLFKLLITTYENHPKERVFLTRYEDLRKNTLDILSKIYKFLEIDISNTDLEKLVAKYSFENIPTEKKGSGKFARNASPGMWKEKFNEEEKKLMEDIMGKTLLRIGYQDW